MKVTDPRDFGRVAVLLGGRSAEREISLKSGRAVLAALRERGVDAHPVDPRDDGIAALFGGGFDRACIMLHGRGGEDGTIQGALDWHGMPYTGSDVLGSALSMDKLRSKWLWQTLGLLTPRYALVTDDTDLGALASDLGLPIAMKPAREGSSLGMTKVTNRDQLARAFADARALDSVVLAERWIVGAEYTASILDGQVLPLIRLETPRTFYDFDAKYMANTTRYHCPCGLGAEHERALAKVCLQAFEAVGASGWGRVDFMLDESGRPWLLEVNTVPGMTDHSLVPMAAKVAGLDFGALSWRILETSFVERGTT
jgi:D-alanine-D-alanine ligase